MRPECCIIRLRSELFNRRKTVFYTLVAFVLLAFVLMWSPRRHSDKPNIIFIVADDLGWNDVGWHNPKIHTPNLNRLATSPRTIRLSQYYVQSVCSPSRAAFLTGCYPYKLGLQHRYIEPLRPIGVPVDKVLLPQRLKDLGYETHMIGKWHLGFCKNSYLPQRRGFRTFYGLYGGGSDHFTHKYSGVPGGPPYTDFWYNDQPVSNKTGEYSAALYTDRAKEVIAQHDKGKPLFVYLAYKIPHSPLQVPNHMMQYSWVRDEKRRTYLSMVTALDHYVGEIMEMLKEKGIMDNTLVVFTTDNGGRVGNGGNNWPLRGSKSSIYEGGTKAVGFVHGTMMNSKARCTKEVDSKNAPSRSVRNILSLPRQIINKILKYESSDTGKTGWTEYKGLFHAVDWLPTLINASGGNIPRHDAIDGISQWENLLQAHCDENHSGRTDIVLQIDPIDNIRGIRTKHMKLITGQATYCYGQEGWYRPSEISGNVEVVSEDGCYSDVPPEPKTLLFNITEDPIELQDLSHANGYAGELAYLQQLLLERAASLPRIPLPEKKIIGLPIWPPFVWGPGWC